MRKAALMMCAVFVALATIGCEKEPKPTPEPGPDPVDPAKPLVEGTFEVKVDDLTADSVTITITPSEEVDYFYACLASDTKKYLGGEDEVIVMDQLGSPNAENMIFRGEQSLTFSGLIGHSHYRLLYFQYDSEKKRIFGDLHRSERITTPDGEEKIFVSKGKDFSSAITLTKNTIGKDIFTDHCEIVFVGAGITDIKKDLSYLSQSRAFPMKMIICKCAYKNVLSAKNIDSFSSIVSDEKGENFGTLFSVFSGENNEYPIATLKDNYIILF
mgnify:CR=1 FL=1